jgi:hypothetical protein
MSAQVTVRQRPAVPRETDRSSTMIEHVVGIWRTIFAYDVNPYDDFFDLGGTAADAVLTSARASRQFGVELPLSTVFEYPTAHEFAAVLTERTPVRDGRRLAA